MHDNHDVAKVVVKSLRTILRSYGSDNRIELVQSSLIQEEQSVAFEVEVDWELEITFEREAVGSEKFLAGLAVDT